MKRERDPTPEEFEKLLAWFASTGRDYATLHHRLTRIFIAGGCLDAEALADEVMNRVAVRIDKVVQTYQGDPARCLQGFAEKVLLECQKDRKKQADFELVEKLIVPDETKPDEDEQIERDLDDACLARCMEELAPGDRNLIESYFQEETKAKVARRKLASDLGVTANALRIKAFRLRRRLRHCLQWCRDKRHEQ